MPIVEGIEPARSPPNRGHEVSAAPAGLTPALPTPKSFPFPYPRPYDIQLDLMKTVFKAIEERKIAIVESPTGTGKSLTLLTSTLTWLSENKTRLAKATEDSLRAQLAAEDPNDPPWVVEQALRARLTELRATEEARLERLVGARKKEKQRRRMQAAQSGLLSGHRAGANGAKRLKTGAAGGDGKGDGGGSDVDAQFLPDDVADGNEQGGVEDGDGPRLSKEVRELMARYEAASKPRGQKQEEVEEDIPKIYYTSRTHTQLRQLTSELLKTSFPARMEDADDPSPDADMAKEASHGVSIVPLGSRKQLCINDRVRALAANGRGDERMNEACLDMQKSGGKRCEFLPKEEDGKMADARDAILATVRDIEDIVALGKQSCVCPYYATRKAVKQAHLVTLPYNLLLQKNAREALGIDLTNQVIVIDEAHNLIDTLLSIYSCTITLHALSQALSQLSQYLARFKSRLKPVHALWINQTLSVLKGLVGVCEQFAANAQAPGAGFAAKTKMVDTTQLVAGMAGANDQVNLIEMVRYLRESKLARKISGFVEMTEEDAARKAAQGERKTASSSTRHASIAAFHQVETFLLSLTDARDDGRIVFSCETTASGRQSVVLKYILLNPAERFKEVVDSARSVILAGGTMEPISDFLIQLFPSIPRDRFATLSCSHVIPKNNLLTQVVSMGPKKIGFEFKFANRGDDALLAELGAVIASIIGLVPDGVVVFLPSYAFLERVKTVWKGSGLLDRLGNKKQLFYEPQTSSDVEAILRDYSLAISSRSSSETTGPEGVPRSKQTGALLFAVVGGKLSEGINFSDALGRCVIMVGLPFANVGSVELKERMKYVEGLDGAGKDAARELYENLCMRAVNQSIGRAIRHANDYATILLVDKRYATNRIRSKLPKWIGENVQTPADFGGVAKGIAGFFREKRARKV